MLLEISARVMIVVMMDRCSMDLPFLSCVSGHGSVSHGSCTPELQARGKSNSPLQMFVGNLAPGYSQALRAAGSKRSNCASRWLLKRPSVVFPYGSEAGQ